MTEHLVRRLEFLIRKNHPDYQIAEHHCLESRRLFNGINALCRESHARYLDKDADTHISDELGVDPASFFPGNAYDLDSVRRAVQTHQGCGLPQKVAQFARDRVASAWKSYFKSSSTTRRRPGFARTYMVAEYTKQAISRRALKKGVVRPTGWEVGVRLPDHVHFEQVQAARVLKDPRGFKLEVIYHKPIEEPSSPGSVVAAIDLGVNVLAAVTFSDARRPLLINGRPLKSINQFANKINAQLRSERDLKGGGDYNQKKLDLLWDHRNRRAHHYLHSVSRQLTEQLARTGVNHVLVGWNDGFKNHANIGRVNNQNFVNLPLGKFVDMLAYKCAERGIVVERVEESYTSKASFLDGDQVPVHGEVEGKPTFSGRRTQRGQYKASDGTVVHADLNGSANILRKHASHLTVGRGAVAAPRRFQLAGHS